ncbi:hypothetical protein ACKVEX_05185 [Rhodocyclaceae bacterium SMB388]
MNSALSDLQKGLLPSLVALLDDAGTLHDPHDDAPTPSDHYAQTSLALAMACDEGIVLEDALAPIDAWTRLDPKQIGHLPFNRLLLGLCRQVFEKRGASAPQLARLTAAHARCTLARDYPSNNWVLLAQLSRLIEAPEAELAVEQQAFCDLLAHWTTRDGAFIDYPAQPAADGRVATPFAYHHKALLLTALAARLRPCPALFSQLRRLFGWLVHCWDAAGYAGGLGRSNHALFGDACLLGTMALLGQDVDHQASPVTALASRVSAQRRADGLLWLDPFGHQQADAAWDNYMHLSVYNAWAAAMTGICRWLGPIDADGLATHRVAWRGDEPGVFHDQQAGVLCMRNAAGGCLVLGTRGQLPQAFSLTEAELRYAGGVPLHASGRGDALCELVPRRLALARLRKNPTLAGWTPVIEHDGLFYGLTDFDEVEVREERDTIVITLHGHPVALTRRPPGGLVARAIAALDWRFLGGRLGRRQASRREVLKQVRGELLWRVDLGGMRFERALRMTPETVRVLNPGPTTHPPPSLPLEGGGAP